MPNSKKRDKNIMVDTHDYIATKNYICKEYLMPKNYLVQDIDSAEVEKCWSKQSL